MKYLKPLLWFFAVQIAGGYILYVGGFDFDQRNPMIGYAALVALMAGIFVAMFTKDQE